MKPVQSLRVFTLKYLTNAKGARVSIRDERFNRRIIVPYTSNNIQEIAIQQLASLGIKISYVGVTREGYILLSDNFETKLQ